MDKPISIIIATSSSKRFGQIISELVPILLRWPFLKNAVFIRAPLATAIVWRDETPSFVYKEVIAISGVGETGGSFDSYQDWRARLIKDFKEATGIDTTAA